MDEGNKLWGAVVLNVLKLQVGLYMGDYKMVVIPGSENILTKYLEMGICGVPVENYGKFNVNHR